MGFGQPVLYEHGLAQVVSGRLCLLSFGRNVCSLVDLAVSHGGSRALSGLGWFFVRKPRAAPSLFYTSLHRFRGARGATESATGEPVVPTMQPIEAPYGRLEPTDEPFNRPYRGSRINITSRTTGSPVADSVFPPSEGS